MLRKTLVCFLVLALMLTACAPKAAPVAATPEATATPAPTPVPEPELDKPVVVLYTNDVHCGADEGIGYAGLAALKKELVEQDNYVVLADIGDAVQGAPIGTLSYGSYIIDIMNEVGYDVAIPGNHEFDYGMDRFFELKDMASFPYISCNFTDLVNDAAALEPYIIQEFNGIKVAFVGICTPQTITSSTPAYFQDESGSWIYGFLQDETGEALYTAVQQTVDAARAEGAKYVIALGHLGIEESSSPWTSTEVIANTNGIDAFLDGHSHTVLGGERVKNKDGKRILLSSTGTKFEKVGMLVIDPEGGVSTGLVSAVAEKDPGVSDVIAGIQAKYNDLLKEVVATTEVDLVIADPATTQRIVRQAETNLGDLCADAYLAMSGADIAFVNGGGIRKIIPAGDITYEAILNVHPFGNALCVVEVTGQQVLDALEWGAHSAPAESGGFLQVAGLTYEIHTYLPSTAEADENGMFTGVSGEYRVKNVMVGGNPLELDKTYTLSSHNYMLKDGGDGFTMFAGCKLLQDCSMIDNQVLINYIKDVLGGVVGKEYSDPFGQGRIVTVASAS